MKQRFCSRILVLDLCLHDGAMTRGRTERATEDVEEADRTSGAEHQQMSKKCTFGVQKRSIFGALDGEVLEARFSVVCVI
jgi:hypothetical protein